VILVDANILIYAHIDSFAQHAAAREWLDRQLNGSAPVGLPWASLLAFLRLATNSRIFAHPEPIADAWTQVQEWLACETVWAPAPTERHSEVLGELLKLPGVHGNLVPDAHLAALAIEHGLTLCSADGDFARFRTLRWLNPLRE
jgi:toxin-antitoxin system PIN domain toxin